MKDESKFQDIIRRDLDVRAGDTTYDRMHQIVLDAHESSKQRQSAARLTITRRLIMRKPITQFAVAGVIVAAVVLGLFQFIGTGSTSGVVWAEVARKVQASRGAIFRARDTAPDSRADGPDYTMNYLSDTQSRLDSYKGDQIIKTIYSNFNTKTAILSDHGHKSYCKMTFEKMGHSDFWTNPKSMVQRFLSHEHRELTQKTVEGVLCEGVEITDPAFFESNVPTDSLMAKIWVNVETGYPVRFEFEIVRNNGEIQIRAVMDQYQWDVELDESMFEPNIPPDYIDISPGE